MFASLLDYLANLQYLIASPLTLLLMAYAYLLSAFIEALVTRYRARHDRSAASP